MTFDLKWIESESTEPEVEEQKKRTEEINETVAGEEDEVPERATRILHPQRSQKVHEEADDVRIHMFTCYLIIARLVRVEKKCSESIKRRPQTSLIAFPTIEASRMHEDRGRRQLHVFTLKNASFSHQNSWEEKVEPVSNSFWWKWCDKECKNVNSLGTTHVLETSWPSLSFVCCTTAVIRENLIYQLHKLLKSNLKIQIIFSR